LSDGAAAPRALVRLARVCWGLTIVYWAGLFFVTHLPLPKLPYVPVTDKTAHLVSYFLLACALMVSLTLSRRSRWRADDPAVLVLVMLMLYGAIDEISQIPVGRSCEMADWCADIAGAAAGVVLVSLATRRWRWGLWRYDRPRHG